MWVVFQDIGKLCWWRSPWIFDLFQIPMGEKKLWMVSTISNLLWRKLLIRRSQNNFFRFWITCDKRIYLAKNGDKIIHSDVTHKLIRQGFPVHVSGTTDKLHTVHPVSLSFTTTETGQNEGNVMKNLKDSLYKKGF